VKPTHVWPEDYAASALAGMVDQRIDTVRAMEYVRATPRLRRHSREAAVNRSRHAQSAVSKTTETAPTAVCLIRNTRETCSHHSSSPHGFRKA
jgi:hypothetical protein